MICINNTIHKLSSKLKFPLGMKWKREKMSAAHPSPPSCLSCLRNRSVRGYEEWPQYYFLLLKCASIFFYHLQSHLGIMKGYMIPVCMTALNKSSYFFLFIFLLDGKWLEYITPCYCTCTTFQSRNHRDTNLRTLSFSKHAYVTTKVSVAVILNLLSPETGLTLSVSSAAGSSLDLQDSETS